MTVARSDAYLNGLLRELCKLPRETEWFEFKENKADPTEIGEYISALSNSAALIGKAWGYLIWGIRNGNHTIVGTSVEPSALKIGEEELQNWLLRLLTPKIDFQFYELTVDGCRVVILEVKRATRHPVSFQNQEWIRVGSYKKKLKDFPEKERSLWRIFDEVPFESNTVVDHLSEDQLLEHLDVPSYFELHARSLPASRKEILSVFQTDNLIHANGAGKWDITNLGAILFAKHLDDFGPLKRKAVRVIQYKGVSRMETLREQVVAKG